MKKLVDADEVLAMFCGECMCRGQPADSPQCTNCWTKQRIDLAEQHPQRHHQHQSGYS